MSEPHGPLQGVRVVACSTAQAGTVPYADGRSRRRGDQDRVPEGGDNSRGSTVLPGHPAPISRPTTAGSKPHAKLKTEEGRDILKKLVARADSSARISGGSSRKNGFGYDDLRRINRARLHLDSGYGPKGPNAHCGHRLDGAGPGRHRSGLCDAGSAAEDRYRLSGGRDLRDPRFAARSRP